MAGIGSPGRVVTEEHKRKTANTLKGYYIEHPEAKIRLATCFSETKKKNREVFRKAQVASGKASKNLHPTPTSLLELSKRTVCKIMRRLGIGCSRCGWSEAAGDVHHIHGRKIPDPNNHHNLTYLCPNCHRLAHSKKIQPDSLVPLTIQIGDRWKEFYFPERSGMNTLSEKEEGRNETQEQARGRRAKTKRRCNSMVE